MSMQYWGVKMYGVADSDISSETHNLYKIQSELDELFVSVEVNGKLVGLMFETAEDDAWLGYAPSYPWDMDANKVKITQQDVMDAIAKFLKPYGYDEEEVKTVCDFIDTYNCG